MENNTESSESNNIYKRNEDSETNNQFTEKANLKGDYKNAALLIVLYIFQGLILGLCTVMPILLQNRGASYKEQSLFTLVYYPYTLKVIWAPFVDACYIERFGRRKTWIIPTEVTICITLIVLSFYIDNWLGDESSKSPNIIAITAVFIGLRVCASIQDCATDGWAINLLKRRNIGHAATCETIGITIGWLISYVILLIFESKDFCNNYIYSEPQDHGLISVSGFLKFLGIACIIAIIAIAIFKKEDSELMEKLQEHPDYGIKKAYPTLLKVLKLKPILKFSIFMLTAKISFAACDAITTLKLLEYGIPKDKIAMMSMPLFPMQIILPIAISRFVTGKYPLNFYIKVFGCRLLLSAVMVLYVFFTPTMISGTEFSAYYYTGIFTIYLVYHIPLRTMSIAETAFFARVSDPLIGATYMTFLNTISNLAAKWPETLFLWLVDIISWKNCVYNEIHNSTFTFADNKCKNQEQKELCTQNGGLCHTEIDGYYIETAFSVMYGIIFYWFGKRTVKYLGSLPVDDWHVLTKKDQNKLDEKNHATLLN